MASPYIAVIGGSYVGVNTAQQLAKQFAGRFRVLLIEKNSHFQHLFAFPRFAVASGVETHKAFIPFSPGTFASCPSGSGLVVQAKVTTLSKDTVQFDRKVFLDGQHIDSIPYSYLVIATGTKLTPPSSTPGSEKPEGTKYLQKHVQTLIRSTNVVVIGAGAVGVQTATDIKEIYPEKTVTLVHSRPRVMNRFHHKLDEIVKGRCAELGISLKLGSRVKMPSTGYPSDGSKFSVETEDGTQIPADFAIICTGMTPQSSIIDKLAPSAIQSDGFISVKKTLQINDPECPNIFAVGDIANSGAPKAARPAFKHASIVASNIEHLVKGEALEEYMATDPSAIHLTLGIKKNVLFRNPEPGSDEPRIVPRDDGQLDMGIDGVWTRRGGGPNAYL